jgi:Fur family ferric uptake transcriptional regulator
MARPTSKRGATTAAKTAAPGGAEGGAGADADASAAAIAHFRAFLRERSLRNSDVREAIVRAVMSKREHFDIEQLTAEVRRRGVDASPATVYRALPLLIEAGLIQPTLLSGERRRYEAAFQREHHDHLVCSRCGQVVEFQLEAFEVLQEEVAAKYGFRLTAHHHELIGVCDDCQKKRTGRG